MGGGFKRKRKERGFAPIGVSRFMVESNLPRVDYVWRVAFYDRTECLERAPYLEDFDQDGDIGPLSLSNSRLRQ